MNKDKELVWRKLSAPAKSWPPTPKITMNADGTILYKDLYDDGTMVDEYALSRPFDVKTATYEATHYTTGWKDNNVS